MHSALPENKRLHPRNRHSGRYDFSRLIDTSPALSGFVRPNAGGEISIDFANPDAVRALNRALLKADYGIEGWDLPPRHLCPPIPGRADMLHHLADLLSESNGGLVPVGASIRVLDIGVGASAIYPLIGHSVYGWRFVGTDIDPVALANAQRCLNANPGHHNAIELRRQPSPLAVFRNVLHPDELFDLTLCNPPFHASLDDAHKGTARKWKNLGKMILNTDWLGNKTPPAPAAAPVTVNNNPTVTISGATNPEVTGRYAAEAIARENQKAYDRLMGEKREK